MERIHILPPLRCASFVATSSAGFGHSNGAGEYHGSKSRFQLSSTYPNLVSITSISLSIPLHPLPPSRLPIHLSRNLSIKNKYFDGPLRLVLVSVVLPVFVPHIYLPLVLNTITQLFYGSGEHRLTTRVSALTDTLVLVICKATSISLIISIINIMHVGLGRTIRGFASSSSWSCGTCLEYT